MTIPPFRHFLAISLMAVAGGTLVCCGSASAATVSAGKDAAGKAAVLSDHPRLSPERDVVVTYRFQTGTQPIDAAQMKQVKVSFAASGDRLRIDQIGGKGVTILDRPSQRVTLVSLDARSYVQFMPLHGLRNPFLLDLSMQYHPGGIDRIAGYSCRKWVIESSKGKATACVTGDGVILAENGVDADGVVGHLEAIDVDYRDIAADQFAPPADFHKIAPHVVQLGALGRAKRPVPEGGVEDTPPGELVPSNAVPDTSQPHVANDSASDGAVQHADQPGAHQP